MSLNSSLHSWLLGKISGWTWLGSWLQIVIWSFYIPFPTLQDFPFCLLSGRQPPLCGTSHIHQEALSGVMGQHHAGSGGRKAQGPGSYFSGSPPHLCYWGFSAFSPLPLPHQGVSDLRYDYHQIGKPCPCRVGAFPGYSLASVRQKTWGNGGEWAGHVIKPATRLEVLSTLLISCPGYYISYGSYYARKRNYQVQEYWARLQKDVVCWGDWSQRTPKCRPWTFRF